MKPERLAQIEALFHRAVECESEERIRMLQKAGTTDPELRREVEALLSCYEGASVHLRDVVGGNAASAGAAFVSEAASVTRTMDAVGDTTPNPTGLLHRWRDGDKDAGNQLIALLYPDLRRLAAHYLRQERPGQTLQPTGLVHELYLRLFSGEPVRWQDRAHFLALAAQQFRHLIIDNARMRHAQKRGGERVRVPLPESAAAIPASDDLLALDQELNKLEGLHARSSRVVELRFFGGLREDEIAEALGISVATVKRDWEFARAWLLSRLGASAAARK
jgi:RNA polymerase sigma factor (TIGR02999 family)